MLTAITTVSWKKYPDKFIYYKPDNNDDLTVKYYDTEFEKPCGVYAAFLTMQRA